jgi:hypothetical protein
VSNFKRMVRERMEKTGEAWSTAARHIRKKGELRQAVFEAPSPYLSAIETTYLPTSLLPTSGCGACGALFSSKAEEDAHDFQACWDKVPCRGCDEVHGYDYDYPALQRVCKGCGHRKDMV